MSTNDEIIESLRRLRGQAVAADIALQIDALCDAGLTQFTLYLYFKLAFPDIPFRKIIDAGRWHRVAPGGWTDTEFNAHFSSWLDISATDGNMER